MPTFNALEEEISAMLSVPDEDLSEEQRAAMDAYLDELGTAEAAKIDGFAQFVRLESARADDLKAEAQRLANRARTAANRIAYLKMRYMQALQSAGLQRVKGSVYSLSIRGTDVVQVTDDKVLPPEYVRTKTIIEPDKAALRAALKEGQEIPGAVLSQSYSLQVA